MSMSDLEKQLKNSRQELFNLRFQMATGQLEKHRQIRLVRRDLARILTEIHQKRLEAEGEVSQPVPAESTAPAAGLKRRRGTKEETGP